MIGCADRGLFEWDGAVRHDRAAISLCGELEAILADRVPVRGGIRLRGIPQLATLLASDPMLEIATAHLGGRGRPVRAILFDKSRGNNWSLGWHQDRTIAVRKRVPVEGFGPWTTKAGIVHVEPPFSIIEKMITVRIHFDDVPGDNAPLLIAPGSHRLGRIAEDGIAAVIAQCGTRACLARRGDVWAYATAIVHSSAASEGNRHRRVLQVDYTAQSLPGGLAWLGLDA